MFPSPPVPTLFPYTTLFRSRDLPARVWDEVAQADVVLHAGDWVEPELLDELTARSKRLVACWGNNDGAVLRERLPERDRKSTRLNSSHVAISYAVFCLKKKN